VIAQTALAVVLLVAGGLFFRTVVSLNQVALGYDAAEVMSFRVDLPDDYTPARERRFFEEVLEQVRALPGVVTASAAYAVPLSNRDFVTSFDIEGRPTTGERDETAFNIVEPGYFGTLGIPLTQGRDFGAGDDLQSMPVAIVNETFARRYFGDRSAIGQHITPGIGNGYKADPIREIVAVVADIRSSALRTAPSAHVFVPAAQCPSIGATTIVLRSAVDEATLAKNAQRLVSEFDRSIPIFSVKRLADYVSDWVLQPQFSSRLLGLFAALSSTLAAIGLYGLISYSVAQRRREIGVRIALGAAPRGVLALVLRQGVGIALAGVALGLVLATIVTGWIAAELYGVGPRDPLTLIGVALLLVVAAAAACAIPARRALRVDPIAALRGQ
jgi:putative ABC transport system permease protein